MKLNKIIKSISKSNIAKNMTLSGICKPISMVISYIYIPVVLNFLGIEKYGVWSTILSILSWISFFDIGIGNGLRNKLTESINGDKKLNSVSLVSSAYAIISLIIILLVIVFFTCAYFMNWNAILGVADFDENLTSIVCISIAFVASNFILSICKNILYALQKASYVSVMELAIQIFNLIGILLVQIFTKGNLLCVVLVYGSSMIFVNLVGSILLYLRKKDLCPRFRSINIKVGMNLTGLGLKFFVIQICALILFTTDNLIISSLYGASVVTPYSTVNKLFMAISGIYIAFLAPIWSAVTKYKVEKDYKKIQKIIKKLSLFMIPFFALSIIICIFFKPIAGLWLGQELIYEYGLIPLGGVYCILTIWCNTYSNIGNGLELMKISIITSVIQAVLNIPLSLLFAIIFQMGTTGILLGTVSVMLISAIIMPVYICFWLNKHKYRIKDENVK